MQPESYLIGLYQRNDYWNSRGSPATSTPVPGPITGPPNSTGDFTLNWVSSTGATSYMLEELIPGATTPTVHNVTGATKSFTGKPYGTYSYQVKACIGSDNCSDLTASKTVTVAPFIATADITINGGQRGDLRNSRGCNIV